MSDHRIQFHGDWQLWKPFVLRGAGFPAADVLCLRAPETAQAADAVLEAEETLGHAIDRVLTLLRESSLDTVVKEKVMGQLRARRIPKRLASIPETSEFHTTLHSRAVGLDFAKEALARIYREEHLAVGEALAEKVSDPRFREAVTWQNPSAAQIVFSRYGSHAPNSSKRRRQERFVARYLQRYCTKNDTIGFFGPVLWANFAEQDRSVSVPGADFLAHREVMFEDWAVLALSEFFSRRPEILEQVAPRVNPTMRLEETKLHIVGREAQEIPVVVAQVIGCCDGRSAQALAVALSQHPSCEMESTAEVYEVLEELAEQGVLIWELQIPALATRPFRQLHALLRRMKGNVAENAVREMDQLEQLRLKLEAAAGDPNGIASATEELAATFRGLTGVSAERSPGQTYAGRTLVYEDCVRAHEVVFGRDFIDALAPALACVLASARWFTFAGAKRYHSIAKNVFRRLIEVADDSCVDLLSFVAEFSQELDYEKGAGLTDELVQELRAKWNKILGQASGQSPIGLKSSDIEEQVEREFQAAGPGWPCAAFQAPDVMVAAKSFEDAVSGNRLFVLGELHAGANTSTAPRLLRWHESDHELSRAFAMDVGPVFFEPAAIVDAPGGVSNDASPSRSHPEILVGKSPSSKPLELQLAVADLVVEEHGDSLGVRNLKTGQVFDFVAVFGKQLRAILSGAFSPFGGRSYMPRVQIDDLVAARASWLFRPEGFPHLPRDGGMEQYLAIRRWARTHNLPRLVFYKSKEETKPVYLDFDSPISTEIFATIVRKSSELKISEMLPTPEQSWLADRLGKRYTSEIRLTATDGRPWKSQI